MININCWRITKYNPNNRNKNGNYVKDDWTSVYDICKSFDGIRLTRDSYLLYENAYVNTIAKIMFINRQEIIKVEELEKRDFVYYSDLAEMNAYNVYKSLKNNMAILSQEVELVELIVRLILRDIIWCKLIGKTMFIHFGYDYYMYIGSEKSLSDVLLEDIKRDGLFVEVMSSPYL